MSIFDVIVILLLMIAAISGFRRGALIASLRVAAVICAYTAAVLVARLYGTNLSEWTDWPKLVAIPVAGTVAYLLVSFLFSFILSRINKRTRERKKEEDFQLSHTSRSAGTVISLISTLIGLILTFWLYDALCASPMGHKFPSADQSKFSRISQSFIFHMVKWIVPADTPEERLTQARLISEPGETLSNLEDALDNPQIRRLLRDRVLGDAILSGNASRIERTATFQNLFRNKDSVAHLYNLGLLEGERPQQKLAERMAETGAKIEKRMNHPDVERYIEELRQDGLLNNPDQLSALLRDTRFLKIADHLLLPEKDDP